MWRCPDCGWEEHEHPGYGWAAHNTRAVEVHKEKLCPKLHICPVCRKRPQDPNTRRDARGEHWCKECLDEFDSIDWGQVADDRLGGPMTTCDEVK